ncbi:amino acid adenylation domain-containing protein [Nostoc sp. KVJ3]|uniref:amino acid adenylation domain-containing protein n=1 Tax=Nostoc sp. KVJ3 TaxID=457945 RepID=UPI0022386D33|nr:amino acid adenylation domain-containing protein [Nostoc sp. KVJ3]MCW5316912.1 amino acid adenylation domain-containing protein [Nostoc sp. KVJ3]
MNIAEFLKDLLQQNVELFLDGERLRYRGPKEVLNIPLLNKIKQHKTEILQLLNQGFHTPKSYPLSYGQQGLWFMYQFAPKSGAYNIAFTVRIRSRLNILALQRACQQLVIRHPTLRTTFGEHNAEPFQKIHEYQEVCLEETDAATWNWEELTKKVIEAYQHPFDLERGPVLRLCLFTRSAQDYIFLLAIHHIAVDGFSFGILLDELRLLYQIENTGEVVSLLPNKWQYKDFVQWQQKMLASPIGEHLWSYWQKQLADVSVLNLPTDRPRGQFQNHRGASYTFELSKELTYQLKEQAKVLGATLYMTLLTAFAVLIHRYTGQEDIIVASPTEGRSQPEFARTVGFFVNILALRVNLADNPRFSELLTQVRHTVLDAIAHQDYPSPLLVEQFQVNHNLSLTKILRVSFNLMKLQELGEDIELSVSTQAKTREDWGGLSLEPFVIPQQEGQNDLVFDMMETKESLLGLLRYNTDLFDETTISRMAGHFQTLLEAIITNPDQQIWSLPLLTKTERHQLLVEWNNTQIEYSQQCIHQLFEAQVELTPDALAVVFQDQQLTYQELNVRANQLAHYLQTLEVGPEVLVGIYVERSLDMVVGLLGILKAGGAYVPLDPTYPQERLTFMLSDADVSVLLTQQKLGSQLPSHPAQIVYLDTDWPVNLSQSQENPISGVKPEHLAYVIYTSGSTGKPKGVMIEHQSLVNFTQTAKAAYELKQDDRILQFASISFDAAAEEIYPCLSCGGTLVLRTQEMLSSVPDFVQACRDWQLTVLDLPTAYWHQLVSELAIANFSFPESLRLVIIGGERVLPQQVVMWQQYVGSLPKLINTYGPTEATVVTTLCQLSDSTSIKLERKNVPIGNPISHAQVYILDNYLQPTPIGVSGELYIGGAGVARGYLNHPDLTKQKFIPNPLAITKGREKSGVKGELKRLYKTGDLARYLPDGNIEFLGRIDRQVKIRGFRIELGEIEAVLNQHPAVSTGIVIVQENVPGEKDLVAYIVLKQKEAVVVRELRGFLKEKLPGYMVPSAFVTLESFPLTPNGKVDLQVLPARDRTRLELEKTFELPANPVEELLVTIWAKIFKFKQISIQDNFFELGGHSLLAAQLMSKINQKFSRNIPLSVLFQYPTVAGLANFLINNTSASVSPSCLVPIQAKGTQPPLFCMHSAGGQVIVYQHLAACLGSDQPVYGLQSRALNDPAVEHHSIDLMAVEYANAIRQHQPNGPYFLVGWSMGGALAVSVAKQLEQQGEKVGLVGLLDGFLVPDNGPAYEDLLLELALRISKAFADAVMTINSTEKQALREELVDLPYFESLRRMMVWGQEKNFLSTEISFEILEKQVALDKIHEQLFRGYSPPPIQASLYIWWASERLEKRLAQTDWSQYTTGRTHTEIVDGNHFTIIHPPNLNILAQQLQEHLGTVRSLNLHQKEG